MLLLLLLLLLLLYCSYFTLSTFVVKTWAPTIHYPPNFGSYSEFTNQCAREYCGNIRALIVEQCHGDCGAARECDGGVRGVIVQRSVHQSQRHVAIEATPRQQLRLPQQDGYICGHAGNVLHVVGPCVVLTLFAGRCKRSANEWSTTTLGIHCIE